MAAQALSEAEVQTEIRAALSRSRVARLFRMQSGTFWAGHLIHETESTVTLLHPRRVHVGFNGLSDLIGWRTLDGRALFSAIEVKRPGERPTAQQLAFLEAVQRFGGLAGTASSADDARRILLLT
jgi:hypothetical protein